MYMFKSESKYDKTFIGHHVRKQQYQFSFLPFWNLCCLYLAQSSAWKGDFPQKDATTTMTMMRMMMKKMEWKMEPVSVERIC